MCCLYLHNSSYERFYYHGRESQAFINDMVLSSPTERLSGSNEGLSSLCRYIHNSVKNMVSH
jgi:hypothetical protein